MTALPLAQTLDSIVNASVSNSDGNSTALIAAQGANIRTYITDVTIANSSDTDVLVELKDGSTTKWTFPVPANGGVDKSFRTPLVGSKNTAWNFDPSAVADAIVVSVGGFKASD